ncbi:MAG: Maf family protein [Candidatus Heimdallarchaeota archaeon]
MTSTPVLILASRSPARKTLLSQLAIPFRVVPSQIKEDSPEIDPRTYLLQLSCKKAENVAAQQFTVESGKISFAVIGCDTIVLDITGQTLGKPKNRDEARQMLARLSGKRHNVLTGVCIVVYPGGKRYQTVESTEVEFRYLSREEIRLYLDTNEWQGRAGAYAIQGMGAMLAKSIRGDFYNVVGLPINWVWKTLWDLYGMKLFNT